MGNLVNMGPWMYHRWDLVPMSASQVGPTHALYMKPIFKNFTNLYMNVRYPIACMSVKEVPFKTNKKKN
jgi:hypothetical protein